MSELVLEEQKLVLDNYNFEEATNNRTSKEGECSSLDARSNQLPLLIYDASAFVGTTNSLLAGCNSFCTRNWVEADCGP